MIKDTRSPEELRKMFGANLRRLASRYPSVSELCRQLGINRTQFNRYLAGESFPRPDVLDRICRFFNVDARILLKPLDEISTPRGYSAGAALAQFLGSGPTALTEAEFPNGFYHAVETAQSESEAAIHSLYYAYRVQQCTLLRSYLSRAKGPALLPGDREIRGFVACAGPKLYVLASRYGAADCRMFLLSKSSDEPEDRWLGFVADLSETAVELSAARNVEFRHLGRDFPAALAVARMASNPG